MKRRDVLKGGVAALAGGAAVVSAPAGVETSRASGPVRNDSPSVLPT